MLNLGHTFAHAIEKNCPIMHGEAVAIGLVLAAGVSNGWDSPRRDWRSVWRRI